jgi:hypothetical protein
MPSLCTLSWSAFLLAAPPPPPIPDDSGCFRAALHRREIGCLISSDSHHRFFLLHPQLRPRLTLAASVSGDHGGLGSVLPGTRSLAWQLKQEEGLVASCCPRARCALLVERTCPCDETIQVKESLIEESNVQLENSPSQCAAASSVSSITYLMQQCAETNYISMVYYVLCWCLMEWPLLIPELSLDWLVAGCIRGSRFNRLEVFTVLLLLKGSYYMNTSLTKLLSWWKPWAYWRLIVHGVSTLFHYIL